MAPLFARLSKISLRVLLWATAIYWLVVIALLANEDRILYHPVSASKRWLDPPPGYECQDLELTTDAGRVHARFFPCKDANGVVLICHSRAGNVSLELKPSDLDGWHKELGCSVLIFDYPGYGRSEGEPSEAGCYSAAQAAYDWLTQSQNVPGERILIFGHSLGTAVAVDLASRRRHRALVLAGAFPSLPDVALSQFSLLPARQLMRNRFESVAKIGQCRQAVFFVHGTDDGQVPIELGRQLYAAATSPKCFLAVVGAKHGDCLTATFYAELKDFLRRGQSESP